MNKILSSLIVIALLTGCMRKSLITPKELLCESKTNPTGIATTLPSFSWKNEAKTDHSFQTAYQILSATKASLLNESDADLWNTGKVSSPESVLLPYQGNELQSRSVGYWKIRVWDQNNVPSEWSENQSFSVGMLNAEDWDADYIGSCTDKSDVESPFIRKSFMLDEKYDELYFHVNSLGYHELYVNNQKVGDAVLTPAETQFSKRSFSISYNLSSYLKEGENAIVLWLGYGWYKHFDHRAYNGPLVKAQLDGLKNGRWENLLKTDSSWKTSESEYSILDNPGLYDGEILDANKILQGFADPAFNDTNWENANTVTVPSHLVTPQVVELNRIQEDIYPIEVTKLEDQVYLVDMGKNFTGWISIHFPILPENHAVTLQYSDFLVSKSNELIEAQTAKPGVGEPNRNNYLFDMQRDIYISAGDSGIFTNKFNYRAYRYLKISNMPMEIDKAAITGHLVHTDFKQLTEFSCSEEMLNNIHDLFAHTLKCLTIGGKMVDCPHYERLGYGGDGNASTVTAQTLFDLSSLYTTWLTHWADCNGPDGDMPHTAPTFWSSGGGPYWSSFIIKAAWETYLNYGDERILEAFYPYMLNWLRYIQKYSPNILLEEYPATESRNWFLGDWATPEGINQKDPRSVGLVTNCAIVDSYDKMIKIAGVLNLDSDKEKFVTKKNELAKAIHAEFYDPESATYGTGTQIDLAYPLIMNIVPDSLKAKVTKSLEAEILKWDNHLATGLVGLPVLTQWIISNEASDLMYSMMTKKDYPGYGYMLENGATTTWEHWRGERSRIHNCYNAPGSWFYQSIGGIRPLEDYPGYKKFLLAPRPPKALSWAKIAKETPYGTIHVEWQKEQEQMVVQVTIPTGSTAKFQLPKGTQTCLIDNKNVKPEELSDIWIESGEHTIRYPI